MAGHRCFCGMEFPQKSRLENHQRSAHRNEVHRCTFPCCTKTKKDGPHLGEHRIRVHGLRDLPVPRPHCMGKAFISHFQLREHLRDGDGYSQERAEQEAPDAEERLDAEQAARNKAHLVAKGRLPQSGPSTQLQASAAQQTPSAINAFAMATIPADQYQSPYSQNPQPPLYNSPYGQPTQQQLTTMFEGSGGSQYQAPSSQQVYGLPYTSPYSPQPATTNQQPYQQSNYAQQQPTYPAGSSQAAEATVEEQLSLGINQYLNDSNQGTNTGPGYPGAQHEYTGKSKGPAPHGRR